VSWLIIGNLNLLKDTINSLVGIGSDVWHSGRRLVDSFFDGIVNKWNEIKNYLWVITGWGDGFAGSIHRLVEGNSDVVAAGKAIVEGLWRGLHDHWYDWLHDKVDDLAGRLPQWLKDKLGISSPAKALIPIGKSSAEGVEEGWSKRIPELKKKVELSVGDIAVKANSVAKAPSPSLSSNTRATPPPTPSQIMSSAPPRAGDTSVVNNYNLSVSRPPGAQVETEFATMAALNRR
jgi:phage-related protein